ncbi:MULTISPECIES: family 43 glycosylhydrolase [unclassified Saccharothrix]|uniref:family 43 glycosylhydrolase n=1 Tax=unclassified Saccharothrix TaxID=2593673 RepID=UPI00307F3CAF
MAAFLMRSTLSSSATLRRAGALLVAVLCALALLPAVARADNPIVQHIYTADPAPMVHNGRVYLYTGHDEDGSTTFVMKEWRVWSSEDMVNWTDHGSPMNLATFSWADADAWAGQAIARNGKFYWYVPVRRRGGGMAIGVAVADSPTGPFRDAIGRPLVENGEFDPTVFIDDDGQAYMYWGNPNLWYVRLNADLHTVGRGGEVQLQRRRHHSNDQHDDDRGAAGRHAQSLCPPGSRDHRVGQRHRNRTLQRGRDEHQLDRERRSHQDQGRGIRRRCRLVHRQGGLEHQRRPG